MRNLTLRVWSKVSGYGVSLITMMRVFVIYRPFRTFVLFGFFDDPRNNFRGTLHLFSLHRRRGPTYPEPAVERCFPDRWFPDSSY